MVYILFFTSVHNHSEKKQHRVNISASTTFSKFSCSLQLLQNLPLSLLGISHNVKHSSEKTKGGAGRHSF